MERLGLWGAGTHFDGFEQFVKSVEKRGSGGAISDPISAIADGMPIAWGIDAPTLFEDCRR